MRNRFSQRICPGNRTDSSRNHDGVGDSEITEVNDLKKKNQGNFEHLMKTLLKGPINLMKEVEERRESVEARTTCKELSSEKR